ncbi:MAG: phytanoyl-CoA dioxygenase family protein [Alphaproteobacteria bacterium]|nr:phytanoyl-CoA dioxygenase family protein [Alphaproteobacteria bacterium]
MAFNRHPLRPISQDDIDTYARDGVVCLRQVFDPDWIELLKPFAERILIKKEDFGLLPTFPNRYMTRRIAEYRRFMLESPLGEAAGQVMKSKQIRFFFDEFFAKTPRSESKTVWHNDRMGWPVAGKMVPSLWIPFTPIVKANSLECIAKSFKLDARYWLFSSNARKMIQPPDRVSHPDGDALRADPRVQFLTWDMEPGDMLIVHPWCLHYSSGNPTDHWRIAMSVRVFGDDIVWNPRPDCVNLAGVSFDEMIEGEKPAGPLFPLMWSDDGARDTDAELPWGFATTWSKGLDPAKVRDRDQFVNTEYVKKERGGPSKVDAAAFV